MLGDLLINDNLSLKERARFLSYTTLILAVMSGVLIGITNNLYQHFQMDAIVHFALYGSCFALLLVPKFVNKVSATFPFLFLGSLIYFFTIPEAHNLLKFGETLVLCFYCFR